MKLGQNVCPNKILDELEMAQKLGYQVKPYKNLVFALEARFSV